MFDLIVAYSVFTHLDIHYQDAWLTELRHLVRPGGMLLLSVSGPRMLDFTLRTSEHSNLEDLRKQAHIVSEQGTLFWRNDGWEAHFPSYYHTMFHSHEYIRRHWSNWFDVVDIFVDTPPSMPQDIVILRRT